MWRVRLRRMPFNGQGLESNGRVWRGVLERGPDVGTRIVCGERSLAPDRNSGDVRGVPGGRKARWA